MLSLQVLNKRTRDPSKPHLTNIQRRIPMTGGREGGTTDVIGERRNGTRRNGMGCENCLAKLTEVTAALAVVFLANYQKLLSV